MFTSKELMIIQDGYFKIIRNESSFIEIISKNTRHCWIIHKHSFKDKWKVYIYHKHSMKDAFYHQHWKTITTKLAIKKIKEHDRYILNKYQIESDL